MSSGIDNEARNDADGGCEQPVGVPGASGETLAKPRSCGCWIAVFVFLAIAFVVLLLLPAVSPCREAARRAQCHNNLKHLAVALEDYYTANHQYPPAYTTDANGRPLLSWRVLILPYLESQVLYDEFKLDEPWDSPHNLAVAKKYQPDVFHCPSDDKVGEYDTNYVMVVGPGCFSEGPTGIKKKNIRDGAWDTIMLVEVANSGILWSEPRDLDATTMSYKINDPSGQPCIASNHLGIAMVCLADGSVHAIWDDLDPEVVRQLILIDDRKPDREDFIGF